MTYEEAIENLRHNCNWYNENECVYFFGNKNCEQCEFHIAIECIEKQIPKPKHKYRGYRCVCGEEVAKHQDYCEYCGQKLLDWSEK